MDAAQSSYYGKFIRGKGIPVTGADKQRLLTDRSAYISFLEVQLERVTAAVLTAQGFSDRIDDQQHQVIDAHNKIVNLTKLIQLSQSYSEKVSQETSSQIAAVGHRATKLDTSSQALQHRAAAADSKLQSIADTQAKHSEGIASLHSSVDSLNNAISSRDGALDALSNRVSEAVASLAPVSALRAVQQQAAEATKNTDAAVEKATAAENAAVVAREAAENAAQRSTAAERAATAAAGSAAEAQQRSDSALERAVKASSSVDELSPRVSGVAAVADRALSKADEMGTSLSSLRGHLEAVEGELRAGVRRCVLSADFMALFQQALREEGVQGGITALQRSHADATEGMARLAHALEQQRTAAQGSQAGMRAEIASLKGALAQRDERLAAIEERLASLGGASEGARDTAADALQQAAEAKTQSAAAAEAMQARLRSELSDTAQKLRAEILESRGVTQGEMRSAVQAAVSELTPAGDLETRCSALESVVEELMHNSGVAPSGPPSALQSPRWQRPRGRAQQSNAHSMRLGEQVSILSQAEAGVSAAQLRRIERAIQELQEQTAELARTQDETHGTQQAIMRRVAAAEESSQQVQQSAQSAQATYPPSYVQGGSPSTSVAMSQSVSPVHSAASSVHQLQAGGSLPSMSHPEWQRGAAPYPGPSWPGHLEGTHATHMSSDPVPRSAAYTCTSQGGRGQHGDATVTEQLHAMQDRLATAEQRLAQLAHELQHVGEEGGSAHAALKQDLQRTQTSLRNLADESVARASNNAEIVLQALRTMEGRVSARLEGVSPAAVRTLVQSQSSAAMQELQGGIDRLRSGLARVDATTQDAASRLASAEELIAGLQRSVDRACGSDGGTLSAAARGSIVQDVTAQLKGEVQASEARLARESASVLGSWQTAQRGELASVLAKTESLSGQVATSLSQLDRAMSMYHALATHVYGTAAPPAPPSRTVQATATPPRSASAEFGASTAAGVKPMTTGTHRPPLSPSTTQAFTAPPAAALRPRPPPGPMLRAPSSAASSTSQPQPTVHDTERALRVPSTASSPEESPEGGSSLPTRQRGGGTKGVPPPPTSKATGNRIPGTLARSSTTARTAGAGKSAAQRRTGVRRHGRAK